MQQAKCVVCAHYFATTMFYPARIFIVSQIESGADCILQGTECSSWCASHAINNIKEWCVCTCRTSTYLIELNVKYACSELQALFDELSPSYQIRFCIVYNLVIKNFNSIKTKINKLNFLKQFELKTI